jgi:hypothetical protein
MLGFHWHNLVRSLPRSLVRLVGRPSVDLGTLGLKETFR